MKFFVGAACAILRGIGFATMACIFGAGLATLTHRPVNVMQVDCGPGPSAVETITGVSDVDRLDSLCADDLNCKAMLAPRLDAVRQAL